MIYFLTIILLCFVMFNYKISHEDIFNPAFVVTGTFFSFSFLCCIANMYIGIDLNNLYTVIVLSTGMLSFTIVNYCQPKKIKACLDSVYYKIEIDNFYTNIAMIVMLVTIYVNYKYIVDFAAAFGIGGDFFECMLKYKAIMTFSDASEILVPSPWYRAALMVLSNALAYLFTYLFFRDIVLYKKIDYSYILIIILYIVFSLMGGGRSTTFRFITAMIFLWGYFKERESAINFSPKKILLRMFMTITFIIVLFVLFAALIGRANSAFDIEYVIMSVFVYAAAPIFNLDIYFDNPWHQTYGIWGELTFIRGINWVGTHFNIPKWQYALDLPFLSYQGFELGNVYTTFYAFHYDFGYVGVLILSLLMAAGSFWCYKHIRVYRNDESINALWVISYAFLINDLIMLPFSNRFYEMLSSVGTWYFLIMLFCFVKIFKSKKEGL